MQMQASGGVGICTQPACAYAYVCAKYPANISFHHLCVCVCVPRTYVQGHSDFATLVLITPSVLSESLLNCVCVCVCVCVRERERKKEACVSDHPDESPLL